MMMMMMMMMMISHEVLTTSLAKNSFIRCECTWASWSLSFYITATATACHLYCFKHFEH